MNSTQPVPISILFTQQFVEQLGAYLVERPFREVANLINGLQNGKVITEEALKNLEPHIIELKKKEIPAVEPNPKKSK